MNSRYGWVIVAAGAVITCVAMGAMFALPVYLQPIAEETGWSRAGISGAMTIGFIVMGVAGFGWGTLSDRIGARPVVLMAAAFGNPRFGPTIARLSRMPNAAIHVLEADGALRAGAVQRELGDLLRSSS